MLGSPDLSASCPHILVDLPVVDHLILVYGQAIETKINHDLFALYLRRGTTSESSKTNVIDYDIGIVFHPMPYKSH